MFVCVARRAVAIVFLLPAVALGVAHMRPGEAIIN